MIKALDGDGHVEEWEATFSNDYLEPAFRDRRPKVVNTDESENHVTWQIDGKRLRGGGSPSSKGGVVSDEYKKMAKWRGPHESGEFHSAAARLAVMDAENTWLSVNYPTLLLRCPIAEDRALNAALTRAYNNWVADISNQAPDRLKWVTAVDPHDPHEAAREMVRTKEMGSVGVMVFGDYGPKGLDHPDLTPIWETANDIEMPVNVHPGMGALEAYKTWPNLAEEQFLVSVLRGFISVMSSGLLDRYPKVKVSFLETGCTWVDYAVSLMDFRLDNIKDRMKIGALRKEHEAVVQRGLPKMTPKEYMQAGRAFVGFEVDDDLLPYMVNKYGTDCWVYASDIPHAHRVPDSPKFIMDRTDLTEQQKHRILFEGSVRLYGLDVPAGVGIS